MPSVNIVRKSEIKSSARTAQVSGLFGVDKECLTENWSVDLPIDQFEWNVGLIVGPSGSGKSTIASEIFPDAAGVDFSWDPDRALVDSFPSGMSIKQICSLLTSVGLGSTPAWLKPFHVLSNGEKFRATMARALSESDSLILVDEFTSVVDRVTAKIGSATIEKAIRRQNRRFVAVSCHYDICEWLSPDWVYDVSLNRFSRDRLRRPSIDIKVFRTDRSAWGLFKKHHYLSSDLNRSSHCYVATIDGTPAAFVAVLSSPHPRTPGWREHRLVCLPQFQGIGIGSCLSEYVASLYRATEKPYYSSTGHPGLIQSRYKSRLWRVSKAPGLSSRASKTSQTRRMSDPDRLIAGFVYEGPRNLSDAREFGIPL